MCVCVCSATCVAALTSCVSRCGRPSRPLYHTHTHWLLAACHRNILSFLLVSQKHLLPPSFPSHTETRTHTRRPCRQSNCHQAVRGLAADLIWLPAPRLERPALCLPCPPARQAANPNWRSLPMLSSPPALHCTATANQSESRAERARGRWEMKGKSIREHVRCLMSTY